MRRRLRELGIPVPDFEVVAAAEVMAAVVAFGARHGWPVVVKTARGGYDGRGVFVLQSAADTLPAQLIAGETDLVIESFVPMRRELAVVLARSSFGQAAVWPVVQTVQRDGICVEVLAPAPGLDDDIASAAGLLALRIASELDVVGVLAVELFEVEPDDRFPDALVVNELAMRPHNSGHWTMDGSVTGQFEQHLRAVLDYPLGRTEMTAPFTVMGNVLGGPADTPGASMSIDERIHHLSARFPQAKIHWYGKGIRPGRKLGHVNVCGSDLPELRRVATLAAQWLGSGEWADGYSIHDSEELR
jgi:5-(carboxyamino)imidazole ribonucleotide synthase